MNGVGSGVWINPATHEVMLSQAAFVGAGALVWVLSIVLGLFTAWLVLP